MTLKSELEKYHFLIINSQKQNNCEEFTCKIRDMSILCKLVYSDGKFNLKSFVPSNKKLIVEKIDTSNLIEFTSFKQSVMPYTIFDKYGNRK
jgi:hypothetical protein